MAVNVCELLKNQMDATDNDNFLHYTPMAQNHRLEWGLFMPGLIIKASCEEEAVLKYVNYIKSKEPAERSERDKIENYLQYLYNFHAEMYPKSEYIESERNRNIVKGIVGDFMTTQLMVVSFRLI